MPPGLSVRTPGLGVFSSVRDLSALGCVRYSCTAASIGSSFFERLLQTGDVVQGFPLLKLSDDPLDLFIG